MNRSRRGRARVVGKYFWQLKKNCISKWDEHFFSMFLFHIKNRKHKFCVYNMYTLIHTHTQICMDMWKALVIFWQCVWIHHVESRKHNVWNIKKWLEYRKKNFSPPFSPPSSKRKHNRYISSGLINLDLYVPSKQVVCNTLKREVSKK